MSHTSDILAQAQALGANLDLGLPEPAASQRVVVAMSGGVDSTLVAALLKLYGYDVVGITLQLYDTGQMAGKPGSCCAGRDIADARRAAQSLDFPHYVLNFENRFRDAVMEDFADTYLAGATPVPCIRCNQSVKFSDLLAVTKDLGAKAMATGHYVRRCEGPAGPMLTPAAETGRDQSWFLFATTSEQLQSLRFPLGGMKKQAVRDIALALKLDVADKPDSQDICFVTGNYAQTLEKLRPGAGEAGRIIHIDGQDLGEHAGIIHYTIGQRRGLRIGGGDPLYVVRLDPKRREVIVGPRSALQIAALTLGETNWLGPHTLESACHAKMPARARVRSGCTPSPGRLAWIDAMPGFVFDTGEEGVAPGQACVLHDAQDRILGGGFIRATRSAYVQAANQASENSMSYVPENAQ